MTAFGAAAPVRLDLAGGWTDVPPYSARDGGVVVAAALRLRAYAEVRPRERGYLLESKELEQALEYPDLPALAGDGQLPLQRAGLTPFGAEGDAFDPSVHEAVAHDTSPDVSGPTVTTVMRRGYRFGDRVLRAAMVAVTDSDGTAPATDTTSEPADAGTS